MGVHTVYNKLVVITEFFCFDLPKDVEKNLEHEIDSIIKLNELLAEHEMKNEVRQLLSNYKHGNDIHEH